MDRVRYIIRGRIRVRPVRIIAQSSRDKVRGQWKHSNAYLQRFGTLDERCKLNKRQRQRQRQRPNDQRPNEQRPNSKDKKRRPIEESQEAQNTQETQETQEQRPKETRDPSPKTQNPKTKIQNPKLKTQE